MPYEVKKVNATTWGVYKEGAKKPMYTHPTKKEAEEQVKALYANESDD